MSMECSANKHAFCKTCCGCLCQDFPIGEEKLIELAKTLHETGTGVKDDSLLAPDFRWLSAEPVTSIWTIDT